MGTYSKGNGNTSPIVYTVEMEPAQHMLDHHGVTVCLSPTTRNAEPKSVLELTKTLYTLALKHIQHHITSIRFQMSGDTNDRMGR